MLTDLYLDLKIQQTTNYLSGHEAHGNIVDMVSLKMEHENMSPILVKNQSAHSTSMESRSVPWPQLQGPTEAI